MKPLDRAERDAARAPRDTVVTARMAAALEGAGRLREALAWRDYQDALLRHAEWAVRAKKIAADKRAGVSPVDDERSDALWRALRRYDSGLGLPSQRRPWLRRLVEERLGLRAELEAIHEAERECWRKRQRILSELGLGSEGPLQFLPRQGRPLGAPGYESALRELVAAFGGKPVEEPQPDPFFKVGDVVEVIGGDGGEWRVVGARHGRLGAVQELSLLSLRHRHVETVRSSDEVRMVRRSPRMWVGTYRGTTMALSVSISVVGEVHSASLYALHGVPYVLRWTAYHGGRETPQYRLRGTGGSVQSGLQQFYDGVGGWLHTVTTHLQDGDGESHESSAWSHDRERAYAGPAWILTRSWLFGRLLKPLPPSDEASALARPWSPVPLEAP